MCENDLSPWGPPVETFYLPTDEELNHVLTTIHGAILEIFRLHPYSTVDSFVNFHQGYRGQNDLSLEEFNLVFPPENQGNHMSCIGLSLKMKDMLAELMPSLHKHLFLVVTNEYDLQTPEPNEHPSAESAHLQDHILLVLKFSLSDRIGYVFIEPGIIIDIPVVVMRDRQPPHTGIFKRLARTGHREYLAEFSFPESIYATWWTTEFRSSTEIVRRKSFVYLEKQFVRVDALERRIRVYHYHGYILVKEGRIQAGFYFALGKDKRMFSVITPDGNGQMDTVRIPYEFFSDTRGEHSTSEKERENIYKALERFAQICGFGGKEVILERFKPLSFACTDLEFIEEVMRINNSYINRLSSEVVCSWRNEEREESRSVKLI